MEVIPGTKQTYKTNIHQLNHCVDKRYPCIQESERRIHDINEYESLMSHMFGNPQTWKVKGNSSLSFTFQIFRFVYPFILRLTQNIRNPNLISQFQGFSSKTNMVIPCIALQAERSQGVTSCDLLIVKKNRGYWKSKSTYRKGRVSHRQKEEFWGQQMQLGQFLIQILFERRGNCSFNHAQLRKQCNDGRCPNLHKTFRKIVK